MIWHDVEQNTNEWQERRIGKVTASQFGCFMNKGNAFSEPAKRYALQIALETITGKQSKNKSGTNEHMRRGHEQEPIARMLYEQEKGVLVTGGGFFDWGDHGDSPDGLVGNDGAIEIKSVIAPVHYATLQRASFDPAYKWQLIGHLDCTGRDWVDFVSYCADFPVEKQLINYRLQRTDYCEEISQLRTRRKEFLNFVEDTIDAIIQ